MRDFPINILCVFLLPLLLNTTAARAQWPENGLPVCAEAAIQGDVRVVPDDSNGVFIAWVDFRNGIRDIYAQRLTDEGIPLWEEGGIQVAALEPYVPIVEMLPDGEGGAYILWEKNESLYIQRVSRDGSTTYPLDGFLLSSDHNVTYKAVSDDNGGMYIWKSYKTSFIDIIWGPSFCWDVEVFHVTTDMAKTSMYSWDFGPWWPDSYRLLEWDMASDGRGGFVCCYRIKNLFQLYVARYSHHDTESWLTWNVDPPLSTSKVRIAGDANGGATLTNGRYVERYTNQGIEIYDPDPLHGTEPQEFLELSESCVSDIRAIHSTRGDCIYAWRDSSMSDYFGGDRVFVQKIDTLGQLLWVPGGVPACFTLITNGEPSIAPDGHGGAIIVWENDGIVAQRIDASGTPLWGWNGVRILDGTSLSDANWSVNIDFAMNDDPGAVVAWVDDRNGVDYDIYAMHANPPQHRPLLDTVEDLSAEPGEEIVIQLEATDPDGTGPLTYETDAGYRLPSSGSFDTSTGLFTWTPAPADTGIYDLRFGVSDGIFYDCEYAAITVEQSVGIAELCRLSGFCSSIVEGTIVISWSYEMSPEDLGHAVRRRTAAASSSERLDGIEITRNEQTYSFADRTAEAGETYIYSVYAESGGESVLLFETAPTSPPALPLTLYQNHPNPFNPQTSIGYYLPSRCRVRLEIFDVTGRKIATLVDRMEEKGHHDTLWAGTNSEGRRVCSGIYYYRLSAGKRTTTRKMVLLR